MIVFQNISIGLEGPLMIYVARGIQTILWTGGHAALHIQVKKIQSYLSTVEKLDLKIPKSSTVSNLEENDYSHSCVF